MDLLQEQQQFGIKELYCPKSEPAVDIVAVHGLNGDAFRTWTSDKTKLCWLNDTEMLPKYLSNARILTWGYNANITSFKGRSTSSDRILQHAYTLVADLHADRELEGASERPIIFLCHSLGGIVVKRALAYSADQTAARTGHLHSIYTCTFGILFFGTPHRGSSKAHLLGSLQKIASLTVPRKILETDSSLLRALEEDSEILQNITDQFSTRLPRFRIFFFWEQERTDLKYAKEYIVGEGSAAPILDGTERCGMAADHRGMCKFDGTDTPGFRTVVAALRRYCREAPETIRARMVEASAAQEARRWSEATELIKHLPGGSGAAFDSRRGYVSMNSPSGVPAGRVFSFAEQPSTRGDTSMTHVCGRPERAGLELTLGNGGSFYSRRGHTSMSSTSEIPEIRARKEIWNSDDEFEDDEDDAIGSLPKKMEFCGSQSKLLKTPDVV